MAKRSGKNRDKDIAFQIEKQLKWEYAQQRKKQKRSLIAIIVCSVIVVGLVVTMAMTQVILPQMNKASESPSASASASSDTPAETPQVETTSEIPSNAGTVTMNGDGKPSYKAGDWNITETDKVGVKVLEEGSGAEVTSSSQTLALKYAGWKAQKGTEFDASYNKGDDYTFESPLSRLIQGWQPVLGHKVGTKLALYIPQKYGYDHAESDNDQTPGGDLVFYIEIKDIKDSATGSETAPSE